jgi:hypothetical protein
VIALLLCQRTNTNDVSRNLVLLKPETVRQI